MRDARSCWYRNAAGGHGPVPLSCMGGSEADVRTVRALGPMTRFR